MSPGRGKGQGGLSGSPSFPTPGTTRLRGKIMYVVLQSSPQHGDSLNSVIPALCGSLRGSLFFSVPRKKYALRGSLKLCLPLQIIDCGDRLFYVFPAPARFCGDVLFSVLPAILFPDDSILNRISTMLFDPVPGGSVGDSKVLCYIADGRSISKISALKLPPPELFSAQISGPSRSSYSSQLRAARAPFHPPAGYLSGSRPYLPGESDNQTTD